ncbi:methyltransferase domain-containing protein [Candidatus Kaiserbacteria bacterium]|nr:methyltransferase domain-containing protein [Candidatus Kaiserbacteria bacterium]
MTALQTAGFAHPATNAAAFGVSRGMVVADFGAGSGAYVLEIAKILHGEGHVYAIDIQQDLLKRIRNDAHKRGYTNVEIVWGDLEKPGASKIADAHADLVLISNLLFQLDEKEPPFFEAYRILKPGGRLVVIDWSESFGGLGPVKKAVVKKETARAIAEASGFGFVHEFAAGAHHYGLVFAKR